MEKILTIKDNRGKIEIRVKLWQMDWQRDQEGNEYRYDVIVFHTKPGKRIRNVHYEIATADEIYKAKMLFWESIKPQD